MNFNEELIKLNITPNDKIDNLFEMYYKRLVEVNSHMNLTAITEKEAVYNKHFLDSLLLTNCLDLSKEFSLCDVGSGAGFPSLPLAIVSGNCKVTIIDALNKRIKFLNDLVQELGLSNVNAYHKRAEEYATEKRESFDVVTARAVARLNVLSELCLPLVKINGYFIAMKGQSGSEEVAEAKNAIEKLGGQIVEIKEYHLPDDAGKREIVIIKKVKSTPTKYPRAFAKIKEKPL